MRSGRRLPFDATIDLLGHHLADAGIPRTRASEAVAAVRTAIQALPGAGCIDVAEATHIDPEVQVILRDRWMTLYDAGRSPVPAGSEWGTLRRRVEEVVKEALLGLGRPAHRRTV